MNFKILVIFCFSILFGAYGQDLIVKPGKPVPLSLPADNYYMNPKFSSDGAKIAFAGENYKGLWIYNVPQGSAVKLSDDISAGYAYSWSSDSKNIISRVSRYEGARRYNAVFMFGLQSADTKKILDFQDRKIGIPGWSNDESRIYYSDNSELIYAASGRKPLQQSTGTDYALQNSKIIVSHNDGKKRQTLSNLTKFDIINLAVSPERNRIVFEAMDGNIYTADVNGMRILNLGTGDNPSWSPDGRFIVYSITTDDGHEFTSSDIFVTASDGSKTQNITGSEGHLEMNPCWSPDGRTIVYNDYISGIIYLLPIELL